MFNILKRSSNWEMGKIIVEGVCVLTYTISIEDVSIGEGSLVNKVAIFSHDARNGKFC